MTSDITALRDQVITPTLKCLGHYSVNAVSLLASTAAELSHGDPFKREHGLGIYQISARQHRKIWDEYLAFRPDLASAVRGLASQHQFLTSPDAELVTNLAYSTAIAWVIYLSTGKALPDSSDQHDLCQFCQQYFCQQADSAIMN